MPAEDKQMISKDIYRYTNLKRVEVLFTVKKRLYSIIRFIKKKKKHYEIPLRIIFGSDIK